MNFILLLAVFGEDLLARVAWAEKRLDAQYVQNVAAQVSEGRKSGVRSVVVEFGVFGAPRFSVQRSQNPLKIGIWGPLD